MYNNIENNVLITSVKVNRSYERRSHRYAIVRELLEKLDVGQSVLLDPAIYSRFDFNIQKERTRAAVSLLQVIARFKNINENNSYSIRTIIDEKTFRVWRTK